MRWIGLVFISMAISLVIIDGTIVNTIFPRVIEALKIDSSQVQWVQESYVLVFAALLLVWGSIADRIGRRQLLVIGILIFIGASVWAGYSQDASQMILARIVQGFGGSMVLPTTLSLVNANFQGKERGIAFAVWGATIGGMVALGPVLGGWLATDFGIDGWRLAFNINAPIGIVIVAGLLLFVNESKVKQRSGMPDILGSLLSVGLFLTLVFGLIEGRNYGWWSVNKIFTIGSCFARHVEHVLAESGFLVPVAGFTLPPGEFPHAAPHLLNEYNSGTIVQRIESVVGLFDHAPYMGVEETPEGALDLFLHIHTPPVTMARLLDRRAQIAALYRELLRMAAAALSLLIQKRIKQ
jgi:MFS family permease